MVFITTSSPTNTLKRQYTYHTRRRISKTATILSHSISDIRDSQCATKCLDQISASSISNLRGQYQSRNQKERNIWIKQWMEYNKISFGRNKHMYRWHIDGMEVCINCWLLVTGVTKYKIQHCNRTIHGNKNITRITDRLDTALAWLERYFYSVCDHMPTKNEYHLPCFLQWKDVLNDLNSYLDSKSIKKYSQPQFTFLVSRKFSNVKLPKYTRLGKCDTCLELKEKRLKASNEEERQRIQAQITEHNEKQLAERSQYKLRCLEAGMYFIIF